MFEQLKNLIRSRERSDRLRPSELDPAEIARLREEEDRALDGLPSLSAREAYLAMYEFLVELSEMEEGNDRIYLLGLKAELEPVGSGSSSDCGGVLHFAEAIKLVKSNEYQAKSRWKSQLGNDGADDAQQIAAGDV